MNRCLKPKFNSILNIPLIVFSLLSLYWANPALERVEAVLECYATSAGDVQLNNRTIPCPPGSVNPGGRISQVQYCIGSFCTDWTITQNEDCEAPPLPLCIPTPTPTNTPTPTPTNTPTPTPTPTPTNTPTPPPTPTPSTPYLFAQINGRYYIDNDILYTNWDASHDVAKRMYESGAQSASFTQTDMYKLRLNPSVTKEGVKLLIRELEPEESYFDEVKLLRIVHAPGAQVFVDQQSRDIKAAVKKPVDGAVIRCVDDYGSDCLTQIVQVDEQNIEGDKDKEITVSLDMRALTRDEVYLIINSWGTEPIGVQEDPLTVKGQVPAHSLIIRIESAREPGVGVTYNDIHPRGIESSVALNITEAIKRLGVEDIQAKIRWTSRHTIDQVGLVKVNYQVFKQEELGLKKAAHSEGRDELTALGSKDQVYAHTIQGDSIELTFEAPATTLAAGEEESYVFVASGYYTGLRAYLYPERKVSNTYHQEIKDYVNVLNKLLNEHAGSYYEK